MLQPLIECFEDLMREVMATWIGGNHSLTLFIGELVIVAARHIHSGPSLHQGDLRAHMFWDAWGRVEGDGKPDFLDISFGHPMTSKKIARGVRAVHLEAQLTLAVAVRDADIVEHGSGVKQLWIKRQAVPFSGQSTPEIDPRGMVEEQIALGVANELRYLARNSAVWNLYAKDVGTCHDVILFNHVCRSPILPLPKPSLFWFAHRTSVR